MCHVVVGEFYSVLLQKLCKASFFLKFEWLVYEHVHVIMGLGYLSHFHGRLILLVDWPILRNPKDIAYFFQINNTLITNQLFIKLMSTFSFGLT